MSEIEDSVQLPVPLPTGWHLNSRVSCPQCGEFMNFHSPTPQEQADFERQMYCAKDSCPQHGTTYQTKLTVDGLVITGVVK